MGAAEPHRRLHLRQPVAAHRATFPGGRNLGGRGIANINHTAAQIPKDANGVDTWWDFANPGDLYTTTPNNVAGADITAVYKAAVQLSIDTNLIANLIAGLTGQGSLAQQVLALVTDPIVGGPALIEAINLAFAFYSTNPPALPHLSYQLSMRDPDRVRSRWPSRI